MALWWRKDKDKTGYRVRRWWNLRKAYKSGVVDFYMTTFFILGAGTMIIGIFRGRKKGGNSY